MGVYTRVSSVCMASHSAVDIVNYGRYLIAIDDHFGGFRILLLKALV